MSDHRNRPGVKAPKRVLLDMPPVIERELRAAWHRGEARKSRLRVARFGVIGVSLFMLFGAAMRTSSWGRTLHFYLFLAGLGLTIGPAIQISVGLFADERRQQMLELLCLTGMGPGELFLGKLLGGALVSSSELLALAPLIAVPFLSGGVSFQIFVATAVCLPTVFALVLAMGSLASAACRQEGSALVLSGVLLGVCCLALPLPYNMGHWLVGKVPFNRTWLALSPALGPWMITTRFGGFRAGDFWLCTAATWGWSILCLGLAAILLRRTWRRDLEGAVGEGWQAIWRNYTRGDASWRQDLRTRALAANAYQWLAERDRRAVLQAWVFIAAVCMFWLLGWLMWPRVWPSPLNFYTTALVLLLGTDWLVSLAAARRIAADRRDGGLELLLTTPLTPNELLEGQKAALDIQFRPVKIGLCGLLLVMVAAGFATRTWTTQGIVSYLTAWSIFFAWCARPARKSAPLAMWVAANCGRLMYAAFRRGRGWNRAWTFYWVWMMSNSLVGFRGLAGSFPRGSTVEMMVTICVAVWMCVFILASGSASKSMAASLVSELRLIAQEPLPQRNDPRFKEWKDVRTRFPSPPGGRVEASGEDVVTTRPIKARGAWFWRPLGRICGLIWGRLLRALPRR